MPSSSQRLLVTGANGNLGVKLIEALLAGDAPESIVALDRDFATERLPDDTRLVRLTGDLKDPNGAWRDALDDVDAIVHFAAQKPDPDASWADCVASADMTFGLIDAATTHKVKRFVFASSNHVMGGYKDTPIAGRPGALTTDLDPMPGTRWVADGVVHAAPAYAVAKLMGERLLAAKAARGGMTAVSLRIGWCQPGENHPRTISAAGVPEAAESADDPDAARDLLWFRHMWLSNSDFVGLVAAALQADAAAWPTPAIVVNAMSDNGGMPWSLDTTRALLGYRPQNDVWRALGLPPA